MPASPIFTALRAFDSGVDALAAGVGSSGVARRPSSIEIGQRVEERRFHFPDRTPEKRCHPEAGIHPGNGGAYWCRRFLQRFDFFNHDKRTFQLLLNLAEVGQASKIFVTTPRFRNGIPITLGTRSPQKAKDGSFMIEPYPDYSWHQNPTKGCSNKIVSVFRVAVRVFLL